MINTLNTLPYRQSFSSSVTLLAATASSLILCGIHILFGKSILSKNNHIAQKQPFRGVLKKRCSENMQQIYRRTPMLKYDFNEVVGCF